MSKVDIRYKSTGEIVAVDSIDARESVATGRYEFVGKSLPVAGLMRDLEKKKVQEVVEQVESPPDTMKMRSKHLDELVELKELDIEGYENMSLQEKRDAVTAEIAK